MFKILPGDEFFTSEIKGFLGDPLKFFVALDDATESWSKGFADFFGVDAFGFAEVLNHGDDPFESTEVVFFDIGHEVLDLIFFGFVDDKFVGLLHVEVEFLGEIGMSE